MKNKKKTYFIQSDIKVSALLEVEAASLEEAVTKSKELRVADFITLEGDLIDWDHEITGVYK